jgi:hypothetical protein
MAWAMLPGLMNTKRMSASGESGMERVVRVMEVVAVKPQRVPPKGSGPNPPISSWKLTGLGLLDRGRRRTDGSERTNMKTLALVRNSLKVAALPGDLASYRLR